MSFYELKRGQREVFKKANAVECVTELACPLSDIISLGGTANLVSCEKTSEGVSYKARVIFNVVYLLEGEVRRKEFGIELGDLYKVPCEENAKLSVDLVVENVSAKRGEKLSLEAVVTAVIFLEQISSENLLTEMENCFCHSQKKEYTEPKRSVKQNFIIDDELEIEKELKNVLCSGAVAQITTCQCGLGSVICDGEIVLGLALLPNEEKSDIIKSSRTIPFRLELEESNVSINDLSCAKIKVCDVSVKAVVDEEKGKTALTSKVQVEIIASVYKTVTVDYADDMFSEQTALSLAKESVELKNFKRQKCFTERVSGKAFCIPPENSRIVCALEERVYAISYKTENKKIGLEGVLSAYVTFENINSGAICSKLAEMPFALEFDSEEQVENLNAVCRSLQAKIRNDEVVLEAEVSISYCEYSFDRVEAITSANLGEPLEREDCAFYIYSVKKGDSLWEVAKALRVSEQDILEQNEIKLPFSGEEKIIIYKKA